MRICSNKTVSYFIQISNCIEGRLETRHNVVNISVTQQKLEDAAIVFIGTELCFKKIRQFIVCGHVAIQQLYYETALNIS